MIDRPVYSFNLSTDYPQKRFILHCGRTFISIEIDLGIRLFVLQSNNIPSKLGASLPFCPPSTG